MASHRITIRLPESLLKRLEKWAMATGRLESEVVREALKRHLDQSTDAGSAYALARETGLIGCERGALSGLSTKRKYFRGLGRGR